MKADRRHELQTNTLARQLHGLPEVLRQHGNKLLMGVVLIALIVLVFRYRDIRARQEQQTLTEALNAAREDIRGIELMGLGGGPPAEIARQRNESAVKARQNIDIIAPGVSQPSVWKLNLAYDAELPFCGINFSAEWLHTRVKQALAYKHLNLGTPTATNPVDGREIFWNSFGQSTSCWGAGGATPGTEKT